jgi:hypothetical protein
VLVRTTSTTATLARRRDSVAPLDRFGNCGRAHPRISPDEVLTSVPRVVDRLSTAFQFRGTTTTPAMVAALLEGGVPMSSLSTCASDDIVAFEKICLQHPKQNSDACVEDGLDFGIFDCETVYCTLRKQQKKKQLRT